LVKREYTLAACLATAMQSVVFSACVFCITFFRYHTLFSLVLVFIFSFRFSFRFVILFRFSFSFR